MIVPKELRLLPNLLTLSRLIFLPVLYILFFLERKTVFLVLYVIVGMTDMLDGYLARKTGKISKTGQFLDSLADIFFNFSTGFFLLYRIPRLTEEHIHLVVIIILLGAVYFLVTLLKCRKVQFIHTTLFRTAGVAIYVCFIISFFVEPIFFTRIVLLLLILSFIESILIYLIYGEVDPDVRSIADAKKEKQHKKDQL